MHWWWLVLAAISALVDWTATWFGTFRVMYFAKPATLAFLSMWVFLITGWQGEMLFYGVGLLFCLLGDVLLMLRSRFFIPGLFSFLVGQIWYMVAIHQTPLPGDWYAYFGSGVILLIAFFPVFEIVRTIRRRNGPKSLITAVVLYSLVEGILLISASLTFYKSTWYIEHALILTVGAALFVISDVMLGFDRYVRPVPHGRTLVHFTYHLAQGMIAFAAVKHFLN